MLSGIGRIEYRIDGSATWIAYDAQNPPVVSAAGAHTVQHRALDVAGNVEATAGSVAFAIEAPVVVTPTATATPTPQATVSPTPTPLPTGGDAAPPAPVVSTAVNPRVKAVSKAVQVKLSCPAGATCSGTIQLQAAAKGKKTVLGKASFQLKSGESRTLTVKVNAAGRSKLRKAAVKVTVVTAARAADGKSKTYRKAITLKRAR